MADLFSRQERRTLNKERLRRELCSAQVSDRGPTWPLSSTDLITGDVVVTRVMASACIWREALKLAYILGSKDHRAWVTLESANAQLRYYIQRKKHYVRRPPSYGLEELSQRLTTKHPFAVVGPPSLNETLHLSAPAWRSWLYLGLAHVLDIAWTERTCPASSLHAMHHSLDLLKADLMKRARPRQRKLHDRNGDLGSSLKLRAEEMFVNACELAMGDSDKKLQHATSALARVAANISDSATLRTWHIAHHGRLAGYLWGVIRPIVPQPPPPPPSPFKGWFTEIVAKSPV